MEMISTLWEHLMGDWLVDFFLQFMDDLLDDFRQSKKNYDAALQQLSLELGENVHPTVKELDKAIREQLHAMLLFSGLLGMKANLDHFLDPVARTFIEVDPSLYLRESTVMELPQIINGLRVQELFCEQLNEMQKEMYSAVIDYTSHLETIAPRLAHYYGYLLGDEILPCVISGYHSDFSLALCYEKQLNDYFGKQLVALV